MAVTLTDSIIRKLAPPESGYTLTFDDRVRGLGMRVTAKGDKSFILNYRFKGTQRRLTIGNYPEWSIAAARKHAGDLKREIDKDIDPLEERQKERAAPTMKDLIARYKKEHLPKNRPSSQRRNKELIERFIKPKLGNMKVAEVRHTDIQDLFKRITERNGPISANRLAALMSKMFNLAEAWEMRPLHTNPVTHLERNPETARKRYLSPSELTRLIQALDEQADKQSANIIRLLLLTGARSGEVRNVTWDQLDLEAGIWTKPASLTKQNEEHTVPLSDAAVLLLKRIRAKNNSGNYVFPGRKADRPVRHFFKSWRTICKKADIHGVRPHDLRHTYASLLVSAGLSLPIVGALLGHTQPQTTQRYAHLLDDPLRKATEHVGSIVSPTKEPAEVFDLPSRNS